MTCTRWLSILLGISFSFGSLARQLTDLNLEVPVLKKGTEGRQEAMDRAVEDATRQVTSQILRTEDLGPDWEEKKARILKESPRYIVLIKGSPSESKEGQPVMSVKIRLASDRLEALLRETGVIGSQTVRLLPLVYVHDLEGDRYSWWTDLGDDKTKSLTRSAYMKFNSSLIRILKGQSVQVLDPSKSSFRMSVPASYRTSSLRREDQSSLAQFLKAEVVLSGYLDVQADKVTYQLDLWQARSGRTLAEAQGSESLSDRKTKTVEKEIASLEKRALAEIKEKLVAVVKEGSLNLSVLRLAVEGAMSQKQQADLKNQLSSLREVRLIRERIVEAERMTYEVESSISAEDLGQVIGKAKFPGFHVQVSGRQDNSLILAVKATGSSSAQ
ncbi:MAG: hypothetical protein AB7F86_00190 [Bdellovibrionales bacterium]